MNISQRINIIDNKISDLEKEIATAKEKLLKKQQEKQQLKDQTIKERDRIQAQLKASDESERIQAQEEKKQYLANLETNIKPTWRKLDAEIDQAQKALVKLNSNFESTEKLKSGLEALKKYASQRHEINLLVYP